jgi:hypothetical protein
MMQASRFAVADKAAGISDQGSQQQQGRAQLERADRIDEAAEVWRCAEERGDCLAGRRTRADA